MKKTLLFVALAVLLVPAVRAEEGRGWQNTWFGRALQDMKIVKSENKERAAKTCQGRRVTLGASITKIKMVLRSANEMIKKLKADGVDTSAVETEVATTQSLLDTAVVAVKDLKVGDCATNIKVATDKVNAANEAAKKVVSGIRLLKK